MGNKKVKQEIHNASGLLRLVFLLVLTLFSSCTLRKSVQAELGLAVSKPLNASKAALGPGSICQAVLEENSLAHSTSPQCNLELDSPGFLPEIPSQAYAPAEELAWQLYPEQDRGKPARLYLLYRKLKLLI